MEINEKGLKSILNEQREEYQRYLGVMYENFESRVRLIAEQQVGMMKKLDSHTEMIGGVMINIERIKTDVEFIKSSLKKKVDAEEFEALEKRVMFLESKIISGK